MPRWARPLSIAAAIALALSLIAVGATFWAQRAPTSSALGITAFTIVGPRAITVTAMPPLGALATPAGAALPGVILTARVGGDPTQAVTITAATVDADDPASTTPYIAPISPVTIPAGGFADIDVAIAPVDCTPWISPANPGEAVDVTRQGVEFTVLRTEDGGPVPPTPVASATITTALAQLCGDAGARPDIAVVAARLGGEPPLETISLLVDMGLRDLGSADRRDGQRIPLLWLLTEAPGVARAMEATLQVFVIRGGTAYPWIVTIPLNDEFPPMLPLTPLRTPASED
jgi:hypothetical protein